ncbi:MAG: helicase-related protein [Solirubrobacteraceae bacterium]
MTNVTPAAGTPAADPSLRWKTLGGWSAEPDQRTLERERLESRATGTDATSQLLRCFPSWTRALEQLTFRALERLAANEPVDPNDPDAWRSRDAHAQAVLHRHGQGKLSATRLTSATITALIDGQTAADRNAGLDWSTVTTPASALDERLARAHATVPVDLHDPRAWAYQLDQRRVLARPLGLDDHVADDLSRWLLANPSHFDAGDLRCWRIGSSTWLSLAGERLGAVGKVERPVGVFVVPAIGSSDGWWQLMPVLALDTIRLVAELGGRLERHLRSAVIPTCSRDALLERINVHALHAGPRECLDSAGQLAQELSRELGVPVSPGAPREKRDRWGRVAVRRRSHKNASGATTAELELRVLTFPARGFSQRRLGSAPREEQYAHPSAVMDLGEAVQTAIDAGLPLLLSTEAAGELKDTVRVGRMKGRPGMLTITSSDGVSATTRRVVAEQALGTLVALKRSEAKVTLSAGARQVVRMTLARPLADDPVLLGRQREMAALKVVGSGVDASAVGTGKTISSGRALAHRASTQARFRGLVIAQGRLLGQWQEELTRGAPGRGLPPLAPNLELLVLADDRQVAGQIRRFDRELGDRPGVVLAPNSVLDRYPADLQAIPWHVLIADEALRYANPATEAHQALAQVRFGSVADCWLLTATPRGKSAEHLDVLVGLAVGDQAMIIERLNTREAGDLMDEINAHRLRVNYGPHLVRVTRRDMQAWMPEVRPAQPLALDPDSALAELLDAIRQGGREAYRRLLEVLRELKTLEAGTGLYRQALAELARDQGIVLGNVGVFVDASVDPETLTHSKAALATALVRQGLVADAVRGGGDGLPLLRGVTAQTLAGVAGEEQVIVFGERVWCLRQLAHTLRDRHGIEAHVADGSIDPREFEALKRRFTAGEFPVLCLSRIGHEGHNLQNASVLCHLDLPWLPTGLEQRVGRAARPGAARAHVQTYIPYIRRGGVEHIVSVLAARGAEHHQILDSFEGVRAAESTVATQLGQITGQVADSKDDAGYAATAARLRVAASVFGS